VAVGFLEAFIPEKRFPELFLVADRYMAATRNLRERRSWYCCPFISIDDARPDSASFAEVKLRGRGALQIFDRIV